MEYYSAIKKNETSSFVTASIDLKCIMLSEISQTEKGKYHMILLKYNKSKENNEQTK